MSEIELSALRRAAFVLLLVSLARWAVRPEDGEGGVSAAGSVASVVSLIDSTSRMVEEEERRARPLEVGERIDPNTAEEAELDRLPGVGPATAAAIMRARESGVAYLGPDDLLAVRGIGARTVERMTPYLSFAGARGAGRAGGRARGTGAPETRTRDGRPTPIDVNRATASTLTDLPGIGPAIAARIVEARRSEPFRTLDDLTRVRGIGPVTVSRLAPFAVVGPGRR